MAQEFLNLADGPAPSQYLAGGGVTKSMGVDALQASQAGMLGHDLGHTGAMQGLQRWQGPDEDAAFRRIATPDPQVVDQGLADVDGHRQDQDTATFADHPQRWLMPVEVFQLQPGNLSDAYAQAGQHDDDRQVTPARGAVQINRTFQGRYLARRESLR